MNKVIKEFKEKNIVQVTIADERWYFRGFIGVPSVTWICGFYPKGVQFFKWLASKGWNEAEAIKSAAGDKGSKIHYAVEDLLHGKKVKMDAKYLNKTTGQMEELSVDEYDAILSFSEWFKEIRPEVLGVEQVVFADEHTGGCAEKPGDTEAPTCACSKFWYAGTIDFICKIGDEVWLIDFKSGQNVWPEYELQISAYKHALKGHKIDKLGILQLGYGRNKKGYKLTEVADKFPLFQAAQQIWLNETEGTEPFKKDYPLSLQLPGLAKKVARKPRKASGKKIKTEKL